MYLRYYFDKIVILKLIYSNIFLLLKYLMSLDPETIRKLLSKFFMHSYIKFQSTFDTRLIYMVTCRWPLMNVTTSWKQTRKPTQIETAITPQTPPTKQTVQIIHVKFESIYLASHTKMDVAENLNYDFKSLCFYMLGICSK